MDHRINRSDLFINTTIAETSLAGGRRIDAVIGFNGESPIYDVIVGDTVAYSGTDLELAILNYNETFLNREAA